MRVAVRLDERLLAAATRQPNAPLLWAGNRCLSGQDWITLLDSTTQQFHQLGLGAGAFIGWLDHNSPELTAITQHAGLSALFHGPALATLAGQLRQHIPLTGPFAPARPAG